MKVCTKCKENKELTEFYKRKINKDGLQCQCKKCHGNCNKKWKNNNKDAYNAARRKWAKANREKSHVIEIKWREKNAARYKFSRRKNKMKKNFNITIEQYNQMLSD